MFEVGARASTPRESRRHTVLCHTRHASQGLSVRLHREGDQGAPPPGPPPCRELGAALGHQGAPPPGPPPCRELRGPPPCLCAGRAAAGCERRLALRARRRWRRRCTPGRLGQPNCCHALRARRRRPARPGACMCCPPINCACCLLGLLGCRRRRALRAARDAL